MSVLRQSHLLDSMLPPSDDLSKNQAQQGSESSEEVLKGPKRLSPLGSHRKIPPGENRQVKDSSVMTHKEYFESRKSTSSRRHIG